MRSALVFCVLLCLSSSLSAQRLQDWLLLGDRAMEENDPLGALRYYEKAMDMDSAKAEVNYKYAEALRANHYYQKSAKYYYKVYRKERGKVYPESGVWLATMQKQSGDYEAAKKTWRRVRDQYDKDKKSYWYKKAIQEIRACDLAAEWMEADTTAPLKRLPYPVNSQDSEFGGVFLDDGSMIFTSLRGSYDEEGRLTTELDDYFPQLYKTDTTYKEVALFEKCPSCIGYALSKDGKYRAELKRNAEKKNRIEVYELDKTQPFLRIPEPFDSTSWNSHPSFGKLNGELVLFFASNREGGYGKEDIWYLNLEGDQEIQNAGEPINTPGSEIAPFYRWDKEKLYFASDWHYGLGGYDLFETITLDRNFTMPENLKPPINSSSNDLLLAFNEVLGKGSLTSNRLGEGSDSGQGCCNDLFVMDEAIEKDMDELPEITSLEELNDYLPVRLYFHNDEPDPKTRKITTDQNYIETYYKYLALLPVYEREYRAGLADEKADEAEDAMDRFFIDEVDRGVQNLDLFTRLLIQELDKGSRIQLTVKGFASPLAKTDYNVNLTSRRIASLLNYLEWYDRGRLLPYLENRAENGGSLKINQIPFGEYVASEIISDNPNESNAIYSIGAAKERKIEIVSVQKAPSDTDLIELNFDTEILDFGAIQEGDTLAFEFTYTASEGIVIDSTAYDSKIISIEPSSLISEGTGMLRGRLHPTGLGKRNAIIKITGNFGEARELNLTFELVE